MNEELKHHSKGLARELKKVAEEFMGKSMPKDFSFEGEAKMKVKAHGKTHEKTVKYSADMSSSTKEVKHDSHEDHSEEE